MIPFMKTSRRLFSVNNFLNTLGLCARSRKIVSGDLLYKKMSQVKLLILAVDASERTKSQILKKGLFYNIQVIEKYDSEEISKAISLNNRKAIGIIDEGFAELLRNS